MALAHPEDLISDRLTDESAFTLLRPQQVCYLALMSEAPVPSQSWKMPAFVSTIVMLFCSMVTLQIFVEPNFERDYRSITHSLPGMTQAVVDGAWLGGSVVALLAACIATWRLRPGSTARAIAAWTAIAVGVLSVVGTMYALYLPLTTTSR